MNNDASFTIRKATADDLPSVLALYENARAFMSAHGNPDQWGTAYPPAGTVREDIENGRLYVCTKRCETAAVFCFFCGIDETYRAVEGGAWLSDAPYGVVHRIASGVRGAASFCLDWAFGQAHNIRIDTHADNIPMQSLLGKLGFAYCGTIRLADGSPRMAFQKEE